MVMVTLCSLAAAARARQLGPSGTGSLYSAKCWGRVRLHPGPPCHLGAVRRVEALRQGDELGPGPRSLPNLGGVMVVDVVELIMVVDVIELIMVQVVASGAPWPRPWRGSPPC